MTDWERVREFYRRGYPGDVDRKFQAFEWIQKANPHRDPEHSYLLFLEDDVLAGYWGRMPMRFFARGTPFTGLWSQETLVDPAFRRRGIARSLLEGFNLSELPQGSLWHNDKIFAIETEAGWTNAGHLRPLKRIYRAHALAEYRVRNPALRRVAATAGSIYLRFASRPVVAPHRYHVRPFERFDAEFDALFERTCARLPIIADRTAETLNWRYVDIPHRSFERLEVRRSGRLVGYAVLDVEDIDGLRRLTVVDVLIDPHHPDALQALIAAIDGSCRRRRVDLAVCLVTLPSFRTRFEKNGWFPGKPIDMETLLVHREDLVPLDGADSLANWYLTFGDSDGYMW